MSKFYEILNSGKPVLVDFFAEWCGPCKAMPPILKEVAGELKDKVWVLKVDIDKNPQVAEKYGVRAVPTLVLFQNGEVKWRQSGVMPAAQLVKVIQEKSST
ncbi:MAG TPA: thioredoxin [Bacteroidia bacterium]